MKYYVLFNLKSGKPSTKEKIEGLKNKYPNDELIYQNVCEIEDYKNYLLKIEKDATVLLCGGDGTLNYFANNAYGLNLEYEILFYPMGSGNDFTRDINQLESEEPFSIKQYIKKLPMVYVNGIERHFINGIGYGIDGYCCEMGDKLREENKKIDYTAIAIKGLLFHYKPTNATIIVDGVAHTFKKVWLAPTMFGRYYGGGMMPTPKQDRNVAEEISIMVFHGTGKLKTLMIFPSLFKGEHVKKEKNISIFKGKEIKVIYDSPRALQIDGETVLNVSEYTVKI